MQTEVPDDVVPRQRGLTNEQMAIRILAEQIHFFCYSHPDVRTHQPCKDRMEQVFKLTEGENGRSNSS